MAQVMDITLAALNRWVLRLNRHSASPARRGRPQVLSKEQQARLRQKYLDSHRQWGPTILAQWARREGMGKHSPETIARVIQDLKTKEPPRPKPSR